MNPKKNILIIDPNNYRLAKTCKLFVAQGYQVWPADSCELASVSIGVRSPDLILIDVKPEIKGFEFCNLIKKQDKFANIPIVFFSFTERLCYKMQKLEGDNVSFVSKPFDIDQLFELVKEQIATYKLTFKS